MAVLVGRAVERHLLAAVAAAAVRETADDLAALQSLLDRSFGGSGSHLRSAFSQDRRLSADALVAALPGLFEMHLAALAGDGAPLVAPVDGFLLTGRLCVGFPPASLRARLLRRDPRVSASYVGADVAFIVHGTFVELAGGSPFSDLYDDVARALYVAQYGDWFDAYLDQKVATEGRGLVGYIEPRVMFAKG